MNSNKSTKDICRVCGATSDKVFSAKIIKKYDVDYFQCSKCFFLQIESPFWLKEAYESSINLTDTGIMHRNLNTAKSVAALILFFFKKDAKFLDYAGGYGIFTRVMRDYGFDFRTIDPFTPNLIARGFDYKESDKIELMVTLECFEHLLNPHEEMRKMLKISTNIFFSTTLVPKEIPQPGTWNYYGLEHGQHISFYTIPSLRVLAQKFGLNFYSFRNYHLFTSKKLNPMMYAIALILGRLFFGFVSRVFVKTKTFSDQENLMVS